MAGKIGANTVSITVKDTETGQTIFGQTLVRVSYDIRGLIVKGLGILSLLLGVLLPLLRALKIVA